MFLDQPLTSAMASLFIVYELLKTTLFTINWVCLYQFNAQGRWLPDYQKPDAHGGELAIFL